MSTYMINTASVVDSNTVGVYRTTFTNMHKTHTPTD